MDSNRLTIEAMTRAKHNLESVSTNRRNKDYNTIMSAILLYLDTYCEHHIVQDMIDTDVEYSTTIHYCDKCYKTF